MRRLNPSGRVQRPGQRYLGAALLFLALLPVSARAQEPQPWTNTGTYGDRVSPALPVHPDYGINLRTGGGSGSTSAFRLTENPADPGGGKSVSASFLSSRSGVSYGWQENLDIFVTSHLYQLTVPDLKNASAADIESPYLQLGDVAAGARYVRPLRGDLYGGVEGGVVFLGQVGEEPGANFVGPAVGASSPFARLLFTWQGLRARQRENPRLTASVNLGVSADQSWKLWESLEETNDLGRGPLPEERMAMSFYGKDAEVTRVLFGASVAYDLFDRARTFVELTGEQTAGDATMRLTPGVTIHPLGGERPFAVLVSADVDLSGTELEASPLGPAFRVNAGLQFAFGSRDPPSYGRRGGPRATPTPDGISLGPTPTPTPPPVSAPSVKMSVQVVDETGKEVPRARIRLVAPNGQPVGEDATGPDGLVVIPLPDELGNSPIQVQVQHPQYAEWQPMTYSRPGLARIVVYRQKAQVVVQFSVNGEEVPPPPGARLTALQMAPNNRGSKVLATAPGALSGEVPAADGFRSWQVQVLVPGFNDDKPLAASLDVQPGLTRRIPVFLDPSRRCASFKQQDCGGPPPTPTPPPQVVQMQFLVFEGDGIEIKPAEARRLLEKLRESPNMKVIVQARRGDPLFQKALAAARRDALLAWIEKNGKADTERERIRAREVTIDTNHEADTNAVLGILEPR